MPNTRSTLVADGLLAVRLADRVQHLRLGLPRTYVAATVGFGGTHLRLDASIGARWNGPVRHLRQRARCRDGVRDDELAADFHEVSDCASITCGEVAVHEG